FALSLSRFIRDAVAENQLQIAGWVEPTVFDASIATDRGMLAKVDRIELTDDAKDPFVGDKISPDLREMMNAGDANVRASVIVQADDIRDGQLLNVLRNSGAKIEGRVANLDMLSVNVPV